ncbi:MAG TPA: methylmalonyl Co-A mutase-associated GTPase MeaB [Syntrophales bacterium]|nr:methylmalonyl Co-A mutase-associated GTPase MeaB [Syntrophales bacterium]
METTKKIQGGDIRAASRLIRNLEDREPGAKTTIKHLFPLTGKAHVIGITGSPGAGKSTLTDGLIDMFRKKGKTVGVLAVDPTSPFTGGAILGDRIRMQRHAEDPGVFVRSLATRGALGGLAKAVGDAIHVMDVLGEDVIIVETVGTGQQEVDIINHSHTVLVVLVPGMGDEIQAIKAGILEIADIFVVNKADREGSSKLSRELMAMLDMAPPSTFQGGWRPPIMKVENAFEPASFNKALEEISDKIEEHHKHLVDKDIIGNRMRRKATVELNEAIRASVLEPVLQKLLGTGQMEGLIDKVMKKEVDPYTAAEDIAKRYLEGCL